MAGYSLNLFSVCLLLASVLYVFCIAMASRKLQFMNKISRELDTKKLLVLSVLGVSTLRLMTFIGLIAMDIENAQARYTFDKFHNGKAKEDAYGTFYDTSMIVMFDLPSGIIISTYVLLTIVWAECFLQSKLHTESNYKWKLRWLRGYMIFNVCMYSLQITLYLLLFFTGISRSSIETFLRIETGTINLVAVTLVIILYFVLNVHFSVSTKTIQHYFTPIEKLLQFFLFCPVIFSVYFLSEFFDYYLFVYMFPGISVSFGACQKFFIHDINYYGSLVSSPYSMGTDYFNLLQKWSKHSLSSESGKYSNSRYISTSFILRDYSHHCLIRCEFPQNCWFPKSSGWR